MDEIDLARFVLALLFVLGLIAGVAWIARRMRVGGAFMVPAKDRRLRLVEAVVVDPRHKLVLLQRDDVEHLVLLGPARPLALEERLAAPAVTPPSPAAPPS